MKTQLVKIVPAKPKPSSTSFSNKLAASPAIAPCSAAPSSASISCAAVQKWLTIGFSTFLPIKLSLAYSFLIPALILFWIQAYRGKIVIRSPWISSHAPLLFFVCYATIAASLGLNPAKSYSSLASLTFLSTTCFLIAWYIEHYGFETIVGSFLTMQALAALNAISASGSGGAIPRMFLGEVTQAGQFAIALVLGLSWIFQETAGESLEQPMRHLLWSVGLFATSLAIAFPYSSAMFAIALTGALGILFRGILSVRRMPRTLAINACLITIALPLIAAGLIADLKRGPWLGAWAGIALLIWLRRRSYLYFFATATIVAALLIQPVAQRLGSISEHFFIAGGRHVIWQIGFYLVQQFPLGIGLKNSSILRSFSLQIPPELTHFHSNLINLIVEVGFIGAFLYFWWIGRTCASTLKRGGSGVWIAIAPLLTWQMAGLAEYNIGDKEIILCVYLVLGYAYWYVAALRA